MEYMEPKNSIAIYRNFDPTHTTSLRNAFAREMRRRFAELTKVIRVAIVDKDCFGYNRNVATFQITPPWFDGAFNYPRSSQKIEEFMKWLQQQVDKGLLTTTEYDRIGDSVEAAWTNIYVMDSYKRGIMRARYEMILAGMVLPTIEASGGIDAVLAGTPFHMDRVGLLFTRVYNDLKGVTDAMDLQISRILAQGMIDGDGPALLARKIIAAINGEGVDQLGITDTLGRFIPAARRAEMIARTEMIRAFHLATIQEYRNAGMLNIIVKGEWKTAGDDKVCEFCASMDGKIFTLDEIEPMIPAHPMCRCIALPWIEELEKFY